MSPLALVSLGIAIRRTVSSPRGSSSSKRADSFTAIAPLVVRRSRRPLRGGRRDDALAPGEVPKDGAAGKARLRRDGEHAPRLARADFREEPAAPRDERRRGREDCPIGVQPVGPAVERKTRIEKAHL